MKKYAGMVLLVLLSLGILTGCGQSYEADESTVFVLKDGTIISADVEEFDEDTYDADELEAYVKDTVDAYTAEHGEDTVSFKKLKIEDDIATLLLEYASASDYADFNGIELYTGSVAEALSDGYSFDVEFASITDGSAVSCSVSDILGSGEYKVVIIKGNTTVNVAGTVAYVSVENTTYVDKNTIAIKEGTSLLEDASGTVEDTQEAQETVDGTESEEAEETELAADDSDDDLLTASQEDTEVVFEFDDEDTEETVSEFSQVYTYIIYK